MVRTSPGIAEAIGHPTRGKPATVPVFRV